MGDYRLGFGASGSGTSTINYNICNSGFVIPKKSKQDLTITADQLFCEVNYTDSSFQADIALPIVDNLLISSLRNGIRFSNAKRVNNLRLNDKFVRRQTQLRRSGANVAITYAFLILDPNDEAEEHYVCENGLYNGYTIYDGLGPPEKGVVLSMHPDCCSPAIFFNQARQRVLICKILKGRYKMVLLKSDGGTAEQRNDSTYNAYIAQQPRNSNGVPIDLASESLLNRFRYSQVYLYELNEKNQLCDIPACILPWATVTLSFPNPGPNMRLLILPPIIDGLVWRGTLKFDKEVIDNVEMITFFKDGIKPGGFGPTIEVNELVYWLSCLTYWPLRQLLVSPELNGALINKSTVQLKEKKSSFVQFYQASYFTLNQQNSPLFRRLHNLMRRSQAAGLTIFPNKSVLFIIPNGEMASLLSLPNNFNFPTFHCIFINLGEKVSEDLLHNYTPININAKTLSLNSSDTPQFSTMEKIPKLGFFQEPPINQHSLFPPPIRMQPNSLTPASNFIPPQFLCSPPAFMGANPFFPLPPPFPLPIMPSSSVPFPIIAPPLILPPNQSSLKEEPILKLKGRSGTVYQSQHQRPTLPLNTFPKTSFSNSKDDNRHKNKTLIQDALKNVQNVGKVAGQPQQELADITSPLHQLTAMSPNESFDNINLRDPRLRRSGLPKDPRSKNNHKDFDIEAETLNNKNNLIKEGNTKQSQSMRPISPVPMMISDSDSESKLNLTNKEKNEEDVNDITKKDLLLSEIVNDVVRESREILTKEANKLGTNTLNGFNFFGDMSSIFNDSIHSKNIFDSFIKNIPKSNSSERKVIQGGLNFGVSSWNSLPKFNKVNNNETLKNVKTDTTELSSNTQKKSTKDETLLNIKKEYIDNINDDDEDFQQLCIVDEDDSNPKSPINSISSPIRNSNLSCSSSQNNTWQVKNIPLEMVSSTSPSQNINNHLENNIEINQVISANVITSTSSNAASSPHLLNKVSPPPTDSIIEENKFVSCDNNIDNNAIVDSTTNIEKVNGQYDEIITANQNQQNDSKDIKNHKNINYKNEKPSTSNKNDLKIKPQTKFLTSSPSLIAKLSPPGLVKDLNIFFVNGSFTDAKQSNVYNQKINYFGKYSTGPLGSTHSDLYQKNSQRLRPTLIDNLPASNLQREKGLDNETKTSSTETSSHNSFQRLANSNNRVESKNKTLETNLFQNTTQLNNNFNLSDQHQKNKQKILHQVRPSKQTFDERPPVFFNLPRSIPYNNNNGTKTPLSSNTSILSSLSKKTVSLSNHPSSKFIPSSSMSLAPEHFSNNLTLLNQSTSSAGSVENASRQNSSTSWMNNKSFLSKNESKNDKEFFNVFDVLINNINQGGRNPIVVIIPDPDLILDFLLEVSSFQSILEQALQWKTLYANHKISIKWHMCITKGLIAQRSKFSSSSSYNSTKNGFNVEQCVRYLDLIEEYAQNSVIEYLRDHVCDLPPRNMNKYMICCMNVIRQVPQAVNNAEISKNFLKNGIFVCTPEQLLSKMREATLKFQQAAI